MDLIYTNPDRVDIGVLHEYELDLAFGADENNFECTINAAAHCCEAGSYLYFDGTEYGGIIDGIQSNGNDKEVIYSGRTWHGILNSKVIEPDSGEAYLTVSGEANAVLGTLIDRMGLADLYEASPDNSGLTISNYKMNRYISGYDGITKMLASVGARICVVFTGGKVILSAVKKYDYSKDEEFDSDQVGFTIKKKYKTVNHLICLGSGELEKRLVVHLYVDKDGNISQTQTQFGLDEVSSIYEYSSITTEEELIVAGTEQLAGLNESEEVSIDFDAESDIYDVGDVIGAYDNITGLFISARIAKKIVTIKNGQITISLTPDTAKTGSSQESSAEGYAAMKHAAQHGASGSDPISIETSQVIGFDAALQVKPNPNLLDNWYFPNPVNQRGKTEYTDAGYCIDRWKLPYNNTSCVLGDDGLTLGTATTAVRFMYQRTEVGKAAHGQKITLSALVKDIGIVTATEVVPSEIPSSSTQFLQMTGLGSTSNGVFMTADGTLTAQFAAAANKSFTIVAVKLELGDQQTLAHQDASGNWVLNEIPDFRQELAKCQRYYQVITAPANLTLGLAYAINATRAYAHLKLQPMRETPELVSADGVRLGKASFADNVDTVNVFSFSQSTGDITLEIAVTSGTSMATGDVWRFGLAKDTTLAFDADL